MQDIVLDGQTADNITALNLKEHSKVMATLVKAESTHREDRERCREIQKCMDYLTKHYFKVPR